MNDAETQRLSGWLLPCVGLAIVAGAYVAALGAPFVWDDHLLAAKPASELGFRDAFLNPFWLGEPGEAASRAYYRPLTTLSFSLDRWLHGDNPGGFHLTNLLLHLLSTGLLFALLRRRQVPVVWAFLGSMSWGLLPRLTEGVAWISGRGDVLAGALSLLALFAYRPGEKARLALASLIATLALFAKESGFAALAALLILGLCGRRASSREQASSNDFAPRAWASLVPLAALSVYISLRVLAGATSSGHGLELPWTLRALTVLEATGRYAISLFDLWRPRTFQGQLGAVSWPFVAVGVAALAICSVFARKLRALTVESWAYLTLAVAPLLLVLHWLALPVSVVAADRYLYLPTAGLLLISAPVFVRAVSRFRPAPILALALALACGARTYQRVEDYADEALFWTTAARDAPWESTALVELGSVAYRAGCLPEAYELYQRAARLPAADTSRALANAALLAAILGKREEAQQLSETLVQRYPLSSSAQLRRATVALSSLDFEGARRASARALQLEPSFAAARAFPAVVGEIEAAWAPAKSGPAPRLVSPLMEWRALRYPEAIARLGQLLGASGFDLDARRRELELVIAGGPPEDAAALLKLFLTRASLPDERLLESAVQHRLQTAAHVRRRLREYAAEAAR